MKSSKPFVHDPSTASPTSVSNIDLRRLQAFVLAAKTQCFGTAAQRLNVVPSAISHAIRSLENELGCELFKRRGPKVTLTRSGLRLMPFANEVLNRIHDLHDAAKSLKSQEATLRISLPEMLCSRLLPAILHEFAECMPGVKLSVSTSHSREESWHDLSRGKINLSCSPTDEAPPEVQAKQIFQESLGFYVAPTHPLANAPSPSLRALAEYSLYTPDADASALLLQLLEKQNVRGLPTISVLPSLESMHNLTQASDAISMMPRWAVTSHSPPYFKPKLVSLPTPTYERSWSAYWNASQHLSWTLEVLLGLMEIHMTEINERQME